MSQQATLAKIVRHPASIVPYPFNQWRVKQAMLYTAGWFTLYYLILITLLILGATHHLSDQLFDKLSLFPEHTISIVLLSLFLWLRRREPSALGLTRRWPNAKLILPAAAVMALIAFIANAIPQVRQSGGRDYASGGATSFLVVQLWIGLVGPIVEELEWRGLILAGLFTSWQKRWPALIISSMAFGAMHLLGQSLSNPMIWVSVGVRFMLGLVMGWVYLRTREIYTPIILHIFTNNFIVLVSRWL